MGDITQDAVPLQQSTEDKPVLCIGVKLPINKTFGASRQELVANTNKMAKIEEKSEICVINIGVKLPADDDEMKFEMTNDPQPIQIENNSELCTGYKNVMPPITVNPARSLVVNCQHSQQ